MSSARRASTRSVARREAACCPFLGHRHETVGDHLIWTVTGDDRDGVEVILDAFYALAERPPA